jgi:peptidoglycan/LPS O-acetylase OafA/YrhL
MLTGPVSRRAASEAVIALVMITALVLAARLVMEWRQEIPNSFFPVFCGTVACSTLTALLSRHASKWKRLTASITVVGALAALLIYPVSSSNYEIALMDDGVYALEVSGFMDSHLVLAQRNSLWMTPCSDQESLGTSITTIRLRRMGGSAYSVDLSTPLGPRHLTMHC